MSDSVYIVSVRFYEDTPKENVPHAIKVGSDIVPVIKQELPEGWLSKDVRQIVSHKTRKVKVPPTREEIILAGPRLWPGWKVYDVEVARFEVTYKLLASSPVDALKKITALHPNLDWYEIIQKPREQYETLVTWNPTHLGGLVLYRATAHVPLFSYDQASCGDKVTTEDYADHMRYHFPKEEFTDSDGDGIFDAHDLCFGGDDKVDTDRDTVPDACDTCPGFDDYHDHNNNSIPDGCDPLLSWRSLE